MATTLNSAKPQARVAPDGLKVRIRKSLSRSFELDVEFKLENGITIVFGPSGAGKTTLLDCIAGLNAPDAGRISVGNSVLFDSERATNVPVRNRRIGYVFQDLALFPHMTMESNIDYGLSGLGTEERSLRVEKWLDTLGIASLRNRRPDQLSGGERQRVALARALVTEPSALLL
ncbi:MAG TPA: ATP-binding cassette domain-containing protein, partial [Terriglobales bacterium]|nr:ATP-binding cassette domain-containing protein [Terriglobales bacterium]